MAATGSSPQGARGSMSYEIQAVDAAEIVDSGARPTLSVRVATRRCGRAGGRVDGYAGYELVKGQPPLTTHIVVTNPAIIREAVARKVGNAALIR
jgi:enolase